MDGRTHALLLTGVGRYADPWHPFERTSARLREILAQAGFDVDEPEDVDAALASYGDERPLPGLLVANVGKPLDGSPSPSPSAAPGLDRVLENTPVLALHAAANSFPESETWASTIGARWIDGRSSHPPFGRLTAVPSFPGAGPIGELREFALDDERYLDLRMHSEVLELYRHEDEAGGMQPSVWLRRSGRTRAAYDAYGHDERAYDSEEHRDLLLRIVRWLVPASSGPS